MPDLYDEAIKATLLLSSDELYAVWAHPQRFPHMGRLFDFATATRQSVPGCGCVTTIRCDPDHNRVEGNASLGAEVARDERIPKFSSQLKEAWGDMVPDVKKRRQLLQVFAEYQRRFDAEIPGRITPEAYAATLRMET